MTDREIVSTRVMPLPRDAIFDAWTDPKKLAQWWGPNGFTNTIQEYDLKPGGFWRFVMHGPDGTNYPNEIVFEEIVKPERIVFQHTSLPHFQVTATFEVQGPRTKVTFRMLFETAAECEKLKGICVEANEQNFDRLKTPCARHA
jgi:uncharacterized protein YndB with AHSA1/START domain